MQLCRCACAALVLLFGGAGNFSLTTGGSNADPNNLQIGSKEEERNNASVASAYVQRFSVYFSADLQDDQPMHDAALTLLRVCACFATNKQSVFRIVLMSVKLQAKGTGEQRWARKEVRRAELPSVRFCCDAAFCAS